MITQPPVGHEGGRRRDRHQQDEDRDRLGPRRQTGGQAPQERQGFDEQQPVQEPQRHRSDRTDPEHHQESGRGRLLRRDEQPPRQEQLAGAHDLGSRCDVPPARSAQCP